MQEDATRRLDASLNQIEGSLYQPLMSADSFARIQKVAERLPVFAVDFFGFECRLGLDNGSTDCALNLTQDGARMLAGRHALSAPKELQNGDWERIRRFYQEWGDTREDAYVDARATWLEFDTSEILAAPNLLFGYWPRDERVQRSREWLIDKIVPLLLNHPTSSAFRQNLATCLEACPPATNDLQIGVMLARNLQVVRLCVFDLPTDEVFPYLEKIGWQGASDELRDYLKALQPYADLMALHLDIGEKVYPRIGVEPAFKAGCWARQPQFEPRWYGIFDQLMSFGLLAREKKEALLSWIGHQKLLVGGEEMLLLRGLSHVKIVLCPGIPTVAKGYFGLTHRTLGASA